MNTRISRVSRLLVPLFVGLSVLAFLPALARASVFDDAAASVGAAAGGDASLGGYILGFLMVLAVGMFFTIAIGTKGGDGSIALFSVVGAGAFNGLIGWWPSWTLILMVLILAVLVMQRRAAGETA